MVYINKAIKRYKNDVGQFYHDLHNCQNLFNA